jgi:GT2 family glycosyltransferase
MSGAVSPGAGGYVDMWGDAGAPGRSIFCGWVGQPWKAALTSGSLRLECKAASGIVQASATACAFVRADIAAIGFGIILVCDAPASALAGLEFIDMNGISPPCRLRLGPGSQRLEAHAVRETIRPLILRASPPDHRSIALASVDVAEDGYRGLSGAALAVSSVLDAAGTLVLGSVTSGGGSVAGAAIVAGTRRVPIDPAHILCSAPQQAPGGSRFRLVLRAPGAMPETGPRWLEITFDDGSAGRTALPAVLPASRDALLQVLAAIDPETEIDRQFDMVIGPPIAALQAAQAALPVHMTEASFGALPAKPAASLVIPLHRRIDFLEVQLALFSGQACMAGADIVYVVDDPERQAEARTLATSAFARFGVPFRLLQPSRNLGFARASNAGLKAARGALVCFMNSDVFPDTPDWLTRLGTHLAQDGSLGLVAPMLLFADGSVQHRGMELHPLARFGGWRFPRHTGKGLRPEGAGLARVAAVTGACMVMRRALAEKLGGFDESFVIGDFEDSDLCLRAARAGFGAAVDRDVRALHLERQSQGAEAPWRMGATLYNAWVHERRWFPREMPAVARGRRR